MLPMLSRHAAMRKLYMLACMTDGGARAVLHESAWFFGMPCGVMIIVDDCERSERRDRSHALVESASSGQWSQSGVRGEHGVCVSLSCSERVHGDVYISTYAFKVLRTLSGSHILYPSIWDGYSKGHY